MWWWNIIVDMLMAEWGFIVQVKNLNWNSLTEIKTDLRLTAWLYVYFHPAHQILWEHNVRNKTHIKDMTHMLDDMRDGVSHTGARPVRIINMLAPCHRLVLILPTGPLFVPIWAGAKLWKMNKISTKGELTKNAHLFVCSKTPKQFVLTWNYYFHLRIS